MIGRLLKKIREDKKTRKIDMCPQIGVTISHLSHIEQCERTPSSKVLQKYSEFFNVPYSTLATISDAHPINNIDEQETAYNIENHFDYNSIPEFDNLTRTLQS